MIWAAIREVAQLEEAQLEEVSAEAEPPDDDALLDTDPGDSG